MKPAETTTGSATNSRPTFPGGRLLALAAVAEGATGLALMVDPQIVVRLLMAAELSGVGIAMSRVAGIALFALGLGCWPGHHAGRMAIGALRAMLTYSLVVGLYLFYLGIGGKLVGILLWPAVAVHAVLTLLLAGAWFKGRQARGTKA